MIEVNGMQYKTLAQNLYADGKKVLQAYCNGNLVYPERQNTRMMKILGNIDLMISHDHTGEDPSAKANSGEKYWYQYAHSYHAKACFSLVFRNHSYNSGAGFGFSNGVTQIPAAPWPLSGSSSSGNAYVVFTYDASTAPMLPNGGGVHPLLGSPAIDTHYISKSGSLVRARVSAELLLSINISAPPICPWTADKTYLGLGYPFLDATATPLNPYLTEAASDINGIYWLSYYYRDTYNGLTWTLKRPSGHNLVVRLAKSTSKSYVSPYTSYIRLSTDSTGFEVPYHITGTQKGVYRERDYSYKQAFNYANVPFTHLIYNGLESAAPEEHLHPHLEDLEIFN